MDTITMETVASVPSGARILDKMRLVSDLKRTGAKVEALSDTEVRVRFTGEGAQITTTMERLAKHAREAGGSLDAEFLVLESLKVQARWDKVMTVLTSGGAHTWSDPRVVDTFDEAAKALDEEEEAAREARADRFPNDEVRVTSARHNEGVAESRAAVEAEDAEPHVVDFASQD